MSYYDKLLILKQTLLNSAWLNFSLLGHCFSICIADT